MRRLGTVPALLTVAALLAGCSSLDATPEVTPATPTAESSATVPPAPTPASTSPSGAQPQDATTAMRELYQGNLDSLIAIEERQGAASALEDLDRRVQAIPQLEGVCHPIAHELGHLAVERAGGGMKGARAALTDRDDVCGGGYTHGVIETALGESRHPERDLLRVCAPANDGSCFHGVGHGLMFATEMNVSRSLDLCDRAPTRTLSDRCGEGVFMQLFSADLSAGHTAAEGTDDPSANPDAAGQACRDTRDRYAANCWFYSPTVWLAVHPDDFTGAMGWCREASGGIGRQLCARGVGSRSVKYHPEELAIGAEVCLDAPGPLRDSCFQGMGSYWSVHHRGRKAPASVCRHLTDERASQRCRQALTG